MTQGGNPPTDPFFPELLAPLRALAVSGPVRVALSGGLDSVVLLHLACHVFGDRPGLLSAIHVNHQLQPEAATFETLCRRTCERLGVPLEVVPVRVADDRGSVEAAARDARYRVFSDRLREGEILLMAHHADDQAETLLFRFVRGSGVRGLAGIPAERDLGCGRLLRPWLAVPRQRLRAQAQAAGWSWVEDPTNRDDQFDRNFLRHRVLPALEERWPQLDIRLQASARACREGAELADLLAETQFAQVQDGDNRLRLSGLQALPPVARRNLLQWWLGDALDRTLGDEEIDNLMHAADDGVPEVIAGEFALRRFQDHIYRVLRAPLPPAEEQPLVEGRSVHDGAIRICLHREGSAGPAPPLRLGHRRGGERLRPGPGRPGRPLKKWLQEQRVPPWERPLLPLVFHGDELVAVADLWCAPDFKGPSASSGWWLDIQRQ